MAIVKMTTLECGPNGNFPEGSLREVTFEQGEMLVNTRHAEWVDKGVSAAEAERLEAERLEAERLEAERLEAERLEAERLAGAPEFATAQKGKQTARR
jgi:hypothetical protein